MMISDKAKGCFCKECEVPIPLKLVQEPYFMDRLKLLDSFYGTLSQWDLYVNELRNYPDEQGYYDERNRVKEAAIADIVASEGFMRFDSEGMGKLHAKEDHAAGMGIFRPQNNGEAYISIRMEEADFSALRHYDPGIFGGAGTWEDFIKRYTGNRHIIGSKYIRQSILGSCGRWKWQLGYGRHLMGSVLEHLARYCAPVRQAAVFSCSEIVASASGMDTGEQKAIQVEIKRIRGELGVPLKTEWFTLHKITGTDGYYKDIIMADGRRRIEFECLDWYTLPFVLRKFLGEEATEGDRVFCYEGLLARLIEVPEVGV